MSVTFGCSSVYAIVTTLNYDFVDFLLFGLTWILISLIWCYHCCIVAYYFPGYFFIVCYYLKLRLKTFVKRLKIFKTSVKRYPNMAKLLKVKLLLEEHNDLCKQIHHYNKYWKKYLSLTLPIFILLICFLSYLVFIAPMDWFLRLNFIIILSAHILLVLIITYCAFTVSYFNEILFKEFYTIFVKSNFFLFIKLKVSRD